MTRTTELLKEIKKINTPASDKIWSDGARVLTTLSTHKSELIKSQLRGRLDALKEEEIWFSKFNLNKLRNECEDENGVTNAMVYGFYLWFRDRLASIQEEIKLIEGAI